MTLLVVVAAVTTGIALDVLAGEQIKRSDRPGFWFRVEDWAIPVAVAVVLVALVVELAS